MRTCVYNKKSMCVRSAAEEQRFVAIHKSYDTIGFLRKLSEEEYVEELIL